jgi:hypothetical protein
MDLFIINQLPQGIGDASKLPLRIHELSDTEVESPENPRINFNTRNSGGGGHTVIPGHTETNDFWNQRALFIVEGVNPGQPDPMRYGDNSPIDDPFPGPPAEVDRINIYIRNIRKASPPRNSETTTDNPFDDEFIKSLIGHEVGHGVSMTHYSFTGNNFSIMISGYLEYTQCAQYPPDCTRDPRYDHWTRIPHNYLSADIRRIRLK